MAEPAFEDDVLARKKKPVIKLKKKKKEEEEEEEVEQEEPQEEVEQPEGKKPAFPLEEEKTKKKGKKKAVKKKQEEEEEEEGEEEEKEDEEAERPKAAKKKKAGKKPKEPEEEGEKEEEEGEKHEAPAEEKKKAAPKAPAKRTITAEEIPRIQGLHRINGYLYMGGASAAHTPAELERLGITHILNCCSHEVEDEYPDAFEYHDLELEDSRECDISEVFEPVSELIAEIKENGQKILVHCVKGTSIAPTIVMAYMLIAAHKAGKQLPLKAALQHLQTLEPGVRPSPWFMDALIDLEKQLFGENSIRKAGVAGRGGRGGKGKRGK